MLPIIAWGITFLDRKSTRLNSSHSQISYAVFCLKKSPHQCPNIPSLDPPPPPRRRARRSAVGAAIKYLACRGMLRTCPFFFNDTATTEIYTLSLHDALPIYYLFIIYTCLHTIDFSSSKGYFLCLQILDRKSTRLNSSHSQISYAVFCLK